MKRYKLLRTLGVICLLWCSLAFACNTGEYRSSTSDNRATPTRRTGLNTGGDALTQQEVKDFITRWWTQGCRDFEECRVTFDSAVKINPLERHTFQNGITVDAYPVKVDFSSFSRNKNFEGAKGVRGRYRGGVYYFYRNSFKEWEMGQEGVEATSDH